jgi:hypothetical protein
MKTPEQRKEYLEKVKNLKVTVDESKVQKDSIDKIIEEVESENKE